MTIFMIQFMVMIRININEAKARLSSYLNVPVAEIRPVPRTRATKRPIGLAKGNFELDQRFFEPLPEEEIAAFSGGER